ncbi:MAG: hypothetical protein IJA20_06040 [Methanocorpusculum sp.]|nr:hypothetical protein [Oscillospiraceae bacterium]MBQ3570220.1 hypothetical protein [Methanocorpusculum sp.]
MNKPTNYNKKDVYEEKIAPLMDTVEALCKEHSIPFFFAAAVANTDRDTEYVNESRSALPMGVVLTDDKIVDHLKVCSGFRAIVPDSIPEIDI